MKNFISAAFVALILCSLPASAALTSLRCPRPWLFFDLGENTLVNTDHDRFDKISYMPGARAYLQNLRSKGYHLGLLVNVPASWGRTQQQKMKKLQAFIRKPWSEILPFDWSVFDLGVRFPPSDSLRKPNPYLFRQAMIQARAFGCDAVYQGTLVDEMPAAAAAGMHAILLGRKLYGGSFYYPESLLRARNFSLAR